MSAPLSSRNVRLLGWLNFCNDFRIYAAIAVIYFAQVTGSYALALGVFSVSTVASTFFELPTGIFSDLVGRRVTIIVQYAANVAAIACYALGGSFAILAVGAVFDGLSSALFSGNNSAFLYDTLRESGQEDRYAEYEGKTSAMFQVGLGLGALMGSFALGFESFAYLFWLSIVPQLVGLVLAFFLVKPGDSHRIEANVFAHLGAALAAFRDNARLRMLSLAQILERAIGESIHQFAPAFFVWLWPAWAVSAARVFDHVFGAVGFRFAGRVIDRFGESRTLIVSSLSNYVLLLVALAFPSVASPALKSFSSLGFGPRLVAQGSLLQREFSHEQRATMGSLNSLAWSLVFAAVAFGLGSLADAVGPSRAMLALCVPYLGVLFLYWRLFKKFSARV